MPPEDSCPSALVGGRLGQYEISSSQGMLHKLAGSTIDHMTVACMGWFLARVALYARTANLQTFRQDWLT
jgi:hypothetical protein